MRNKKEKIITLIFILFSSIFVSIPLLKFNAQYDDGIQHIYRLIGTFQSIQEKGLIFPVIMQNLCNGFGYSWNLFYSPITSYAPLIFRVLGFSYENSMKIFMFFVSIASGYAMYFFMKKILKNKEEITDARKNAIAILGACLYIFAPYRLNDMYIRVAVAELTSFIFIPIVFNGLYSIINENKKSYILAWGIIGMLLSHLLITFYLAIICAFYVIVNIKKLNKKTITNLAKNIVLALIVTAFYTVPLIESKMATEYEVFKSSHMVRENLLIACKVKPLELIFIKENRMAYFLGLPIIVGLLFTIKMIANSIKTKNIEIKQENTILYNFFLIMGIICIILTMDFIPFEKFPGFMTMMQFSFRLLEFSSFFFTVIASLNWGLAFKKFGIAYVLIILLVTADLLIPVVKNIDFGNRYIEEDALIQGVPVTQNTGRVHAGCASFEYLPSKTFNNRNYIAQREDIPIVLEGNAQIIDFKKNGTNCSFKVKGYGKIELPYIYYIGYIARVNGKKIEITESENGFLQIELRSIANSQSDSNIVNDEEEMNAVEVKISYEGTIAMKISLALSIIGMIFILSLEIKEII